MLLNLKKSAKLGNLYSQSKLRYCYDFGQGTKYSPRKAIYCYKKSTDQNNPQGMNNLGVCYENGQYVERNMQ